MRNASIQQAAGHQVASDSAALLRALFMPLDHLLASGGDARLQLSPMERLNGYGCRPWPRPEAFTFASSTATSISERAYARANNARERLIEASLTRGVREAFDTRVEQMRAELKARLQLDKAIEIIFSPSGTDSQLHALFIARALLGTPLVSVIAAADQTGSGTVHTARGCHFADRTAQGIAVEKTAPVEGMSSGVTSVEISLRDENGIVRPADVLDRMILDAVAAAVRGGGKVLLQVMNSSKLGWKCPSDECLQTIRTQWPENVQIVIDACQMRLSRARIRQYLDCGYLILMTGSKFFTGPPFSGALLVPAQVSKQMTDIHDVPLGLGDYTNRNDWPMSWPDIRAQFTATPNFGQWLRWEAALEEMRAYYAVPGAFRRSALARFGEAVMQILELSPSLEPLACPPREIDNEEMSLTTIFPFAIRRNGDLLQLSDCTKIYRALNSYFNPANATDDERQLAAQLCHIGQPVALRREGGTMAVLRISAGARIVSETWSTDDAIAQANLQHEIDQVATICKKIEFLVTRLDELQ